MNDVNIFFFFLNSFKSRNVFSNKFEILGTNGKVQSFRENAISDFDTEVINRRRDQFLYNQRVFLFMYLRRTAQRRGDFRDRLS